MDLLVRVSLALRKGVRRGLGLAVVLVLGWGVVSDAEAPLEPLWLLGWGLVWISALVRGLFDRWRTSRADSWIDLELALLLVVAIYGALGRTDGGLSSSLYPLVYVLVAVISAFARPAVAAVSLGVLVTLEGSIRYAALGERSLGPLSAHTAFIATFAVLNLVFLRAEIARIRVRARGRLDAELARMRDAARSYRLFGAPRAAGEPAPARAGDDEKLARSSVEEIHQAVLFALELLRQSLGLHTALLLWQNEAGTHARISELSTESEHVSEGPFLSGDGIIGAVLARSANVVLSDLKPGYKLPYYAGPCPVRTVCGSPGDGTREGARRLARRSGRATPRSPRKTRKCSSSATRYIVRAIQNERVFVQLERAKVEQGKLYRAAEALGAAR